MYTPFVPRINISAFDVAAATALLDIDRAVEIAVDANIESIEDSFQELTDAIAAKGLYWAKWSNEYLEANTAAIRARLASSSATAQHEINLWESYLVQRQDAENKTQAERLEALESSIGEMFVDAVVEIKDIVTLEHDAIGDTIEDATDKIAEEAGELLGTGLGKLIPVIADLADSFGTALAAGIVGAETSGSTILSDTIKAVKDMPDLPAVAKPILEEASKPESEFGLMILGITLFPVLSQIFGAFMKPIVTPIEYTMNRAATPYRFGPSEITNLHLRGYPRTVPELTWFEDLKDLGANDERIEAIKELANYLPSPQEVMTWAAREVFEPELRTKYQLDLHLPPEYLTWAAKVGITDEVAKNWWAAHWVLPSITSIMELWRRQELTDDEVKDFWTELDMVPWIRDKLFLLFKEVPTRVDVRRWWDMRTIDEARLEQIYKALGYWGDDLEDYTTWTKVYTAFPDLIARYKGGWITEETVKAELIEYGMPTDRVDVMWETKFKKVVAVERVVKERDLTKSEIYRGVKKGIITRVEGIEDIEEMGYDHEEAVFIMDVNVPEDTEDKVVKDRDLTKSEILKALKVAEITEGEALDRLLIRRYAPDDAQLILDIFKASIAPPPEIELRQESKADIIKAVKKGLIAHEDGYLRLLDIGFSEDASIFILDVHVETEPFSPTTPSEFKALINKYKRVQGIEVTDISPEVIEAERNLLNLQKRIEVATQRGDQTLLDTLQPQFAEAQVKLRELLILSQPPS